MALIPPCHKYGKPVTLRAEWPLSISLVLEFWLRDCKGLCRGCLGMPEIPCEVALGDLKSQKTGTSKGFTPER